MASSEAISSGYTVFEKKIGSGFSRTRLNVQLGDLGDPQKLHMLKRTKNI